MTISDLSMIWVNISPLYFCFISLFFQPLVLPYGSVYCFKFKIWYSRFYWSRSTKDPQPSLVCRCGFFRPSQVRVNIPKRKFRTELMHFSQSCEENVWMGSFSKNWNKYVGFFCKKIFFLACGCGWRSRSRPPSPGVSDHFKESRSVEPAQVLHYMSAVIRISILPRIWHYKIIYSEFVRP